MMLFAARVLVSPHDHGILRVTGEGISNAVHTDLLIATHRGAPFYRDSRKLRGQRRSILAIKASKRN